MRWLVVALILTPTTARALEKFECNLAIDEYNTTVGFLNNAVREYTACLAESRGRKKCSWEFEHLRTTQFQFEIVVAKLDDTCFLYRP